MLPIFSTLCVQWGKFLFYFNRILASACKTHFPQEYSWKSIALRCLLLPMSVLQYIRMNFLEYVFFDCNIETTLTLSLNLIINFYLIPCTFCETLYIPFAKRKRYINKLFDTTQTRTNTDSSRSPGKQSLESRSLKF